MDIKQLRTNANIQFGRKQFPKDTILTVGNEINEKEYEALITMGKEIFVLSEKVSTGPSMSAIEEIEILEHIDAIEEANKKLLEENTAIKIENEELKAELQARDKLREQEQPKDPVPGKQSEKSKKASE
jgi:hypothetical protein